MVPTFTATSGCTFTAKIDECEMSDYDPDNLRHGSIDVTQTSSGNDLHDFRIYPVPADQSLTVEFSLDKDSQVRLTVIDVSGKIITTALDEYFQKGPIKARFNTEYLTPGVYVCVIRAGER